MTFREEQLAAFADPTVISSHAFTFFEGWTDEQNQLLSRTGKVLLHQLNDFLNYSGQYALPQKPPAERRFRILSFPRLENGRLKLGFSEAAFKRIKESWQLHDLTLEAFLNNNGILSSFETQQTKSILMKVPASRSVGFDCVSISHDLTNDITNVLYHSLVDEPGIFDALKDSPERCLQPEFFTTVLYRCHQRRLERHRNTIDDAIVQSERHTKFGGPGRLFGHRYQHEEPTVEVDSDSVTKRLSFVQTELAVIGHIARFSVECGRWLVQMLEKSERERKELLDVEVLDDLRMTIDEAEYTRRRAVTLLSQLQGVKDRVQSQTTLVLNTIAQNEAEHTAAIAADSRRDSSAMKTIAVLTILFLPGTFVATFFSMTMFDWNPSRGRSPKVSSFMWVYWLISIPLTLMVMLVWLFWSRRENLKAQRRLRSGKIENGSVTGFLRSEKA